MTCEYLTNDVGLENDRLLIWHSLPLDVTLKQQDDSFHTEYTQEETDGGS